MGSGGVEQTHGRAVAGEGGYRPSPSTGIVASMRRNLPAAEALRSVLEAARPLPAERVPIAAAQGRVLAEAIVSGRTLPPADCSAMDGYAVRAADLGAASAASPRALAVRFEVAAGGTASAAIGAGEAARIFTGAPLPPGADTVVRQEDTRRDGDRALFVAGEERGAVCGSAVLADGRKAGKRASLCGR